MSPLAEVRLVHSIRRQAGSRANFHGCTGRLSKYYVAQGGTMLRFNLRVHVGYHDACSPAQVYACVLVCYACMSRSPACSRSLFLFPIFSRFSAHISA